MSIKKIMLSLLVAAIFANSALAYQFATKEDYLAYVKKMAYRVYDHDPDIRLQWSVLQAEDTQYRKITADIAFGAVTDHSFKKVWFFEEDDRIILYKEDDPRLHAISRVKVFDKNGDFDGHATASVIDPCYIATTRHTYNKKSSNSVRFYSSRENKKYKATCVVSGKYPEADETSDDWVILKLDTCLPEDHPKLKTLDAKYSSVDVYSSIKNLEKKGIPLVMLGYPGDKVFENRKKDIDQLVFADLNCTATNLYKKANTEGSVESTFAHNCAGYPGASGSPMIVNYKGENIILGMHRGHFSHNPDCSKNRRRIIPKEEYGMESRCKYYNQALSAAPISRGLKRAKELEGTGRRECEIDPI
jgi:hypothetical protein